MSTPEPRLLADTTLLVDLLRGRAEALEYLAGRTERVSISALVVAELFAGVRPADELAVNRLLTLFDVFPVSPRSAQLGGVYRRRYGPTHGTSLIDALIAATAQIHGCRLVTHNRRHFPMMDDVIVPY